MGGDITGKMIVPIVSRGAGAYLATLYGRQLEVHDDGLPKLRKTIADVGYHGYETTPEEMERFRADPAAVTELFGQLMHETLGRWLALADERLARTGVRCFFSPRELPEEELAAYIEKQAEAVGDIAGRWPSTRAASTPRASCAGRSSRCPGRRGCVAISSSPASPSGPLTVAVIGSARLWPPDPRCERAAGIGAAVALEQRAALVGLVRGAARAPAGRRRRGRRRRRHRHAVRGVDRLGRAADRARRGRPDLPSAGLAAGPGSVRPITWSSTSGIWPSGRSVSARSRPSSTSGQPRRPGRRAEPPPAVSPQSRKKACPCHPRRP
ncbi:MAG: hypothetical protein ACRDRJ_34365 [Streptosporangiaceae bacterium]